MLQLKLLKNGEIVDLNQDRISIGRDPSNDLVIDDDKVSGFHANIIKNLEKYEIVDLGSSNGTFINGGYVKGRQSLSAWDSLSLGGVEAEVVDTDGRRPTMVQPVIQDTDTGPVSFSSDAGTACLRLNTGGNHPKVQMIEKDITIGRDPSNTLCLDVSTVSSRHASIRKINRGYELSDQGSTNGTYVNGKRVQQIKLKNNDIIQFDQVEYCFESDDSVGAQTVVNPVIRDIPVSQTMISPSINDASEPDVSDTMDTVGEVDAMVRLASDMLKDEKPAARIAEPVIEKASPDPVLPESVPEQTGIKWLYFSSQGRIPRATLFFSFLGMLLVMGPIYVFCTSLLGENAMMPGTKENSLLALIMGVISFYPAYCLYAKRLHDLNKDGIWGAVFLIAYYIYSGLIGFVPQVMVVGMILVPCNLIFSIYLIFFKGTNGSNRFGKPYKS